MLKLSHKLAILSFNKIAKNLYFWIFEILRYAQYDKILGTNMTKFKQMLNFRLKFIKFCLKIQPLCVNFSLNSAF